MGLLDGILKAAQYGATGGTLQQERAANAQILAANQRSLDMQADKTLAGRIRASDLDPYIDFNRDNDPSKPLISFKFDEAFEKNPALAVEFINTVPSNITKFYDESGKLQQGKIAGVVKVGKDQYALEIERPDGKKTRGGRNPPMTYGATSADDDGTIILTKDQLNGLATARMQVMLANGAFDGGESLRREMARVHGAMEAQKLEERGAVMGYIDRLLETEGVPPDYARSIMDQALRKAEESDEALISFVEDELGLDLEPVFQGLEQKAATPEAAQDAPAKAGLFEQAIDVFGNVSRDVNRTLGLAVNAESAAKPPGPIERGVTQAADVLGGLSRDFNKALGLTVAPTEPPAPAPVTAPTPGSKQALANVQRRIDGTENDPQRTDYSYESFRQRAGLPVPGDTQKSSISPDIDAAPEPVKQAILGEDMTPEARKAAILQAIESSLAAPTQKQVEYIREYMLKNGYTSPEKLTSAPPQEVMNIAFTMASLMGPETTMGQRMAVAQSVMNFAQFGDSTMSSKDAQALQLKRQELQIEGSKELRAVAEAQQKPIEDLTEEYNEAFEPAMELLGKVTAAVGKDDRGFRTGKFAREGTDAFNQIYTSWRLAPEGSGTKIAFERALAEALPEVLANHIINEPRANLGEWFTGPITDLVARAKSRELKLDFGDFRVETSKDGKVKNLFLVTANGPDAERGQINARQFNAYFGDGMAEFIISTIEKTQNEKTQQLKQVQ